VNYEPSTLNGLKEAKQLGKEHHPEYNDKLVRQAIDRTNNFGQAGDTYRSFEEWEKAELISNLVDALKICQPHIQEKMIEHFTIADADYGRRLSEGLAEAKKVMMNEEKNHTGSYEADKATDKAQKEGHEADPY
jgi:catalase